MAIISPLLMLVLFNYTGQISSTFFGISMSIYAFIYHPALSTTRLIELEVIKKEDFYKGFNPFWMREHFNILFFGV